jgi:UV DNA damage repair endonuclease
VLVNWAKCKAYALEYASRENPKLTRVSKDLIPLLEVKVRDLLRFHVQQSIGKTVQATTHRRGSDLRPAGQPD